MYSDNTDLLRTIWVWPTGNYPRRVVFYLKAKSLSRILLRASDNPHGELQLNSLAINMAVGDFVPTQNGVEGRPKGCSLPVLRISTATSCTMIRQSSSILEYLEETYPASQGYTDLSGGSIERRAAVRDIVQLVNEVGPLIGVDFRHTNEMTLAWSGLTKDQMQPVAGEDVRKQWQGMFARLEDWVREDIVGNGALSLVGLHDKVTLADISLAASVCSLKEMFGTDILEGFEVLKVWFQRFKESPFFVSRDELEMIEKDGFMGLFRA